MSARDAAPLAPTPSRTAMRRWDRAMKDGGHRHAPHRFVDITEDLTVLVVFARGGVSPPGP